MQRFKVHGPILALLLCLPGTAGAQVGSVVEVPAPSLSPMDSERARAQDLRARIAAAQDSLSFCMAALAEHRANQPRASGGAGAVGKWQKDLKVLEKRVEAKRKQLAALERKLRKLHPPQRK